MNKKNYNFSICFICLIFTFFLITRNKEVLESVTFSISIWKDNLFPTLFPFFVVSNLLIQYGFADIIGSILNKPMNNIFKLSGSSGFVLITSLFSGFPSGAKNIVNLLENNKITKDEANRLLTFTHFSNPLFIISFIGSILNIKIAYIILISHIIAGLIVGKLYSINIKENLTIYNKKKENNYIPFGKGLEKAITDSMQTLFLLLGIVTIFLILSCLIKTYLNLSNFSDILVSGILEMTQGIKKIIYLDINNYIKTILVTLFISFGGLSVHMQVLGIISNHKLKYKHFFIARIIHSIIAIMLVSILYYFIH